MRHYFEFDGVKSSDFGVFISGAQTMGAAGRDVDEIVVPGRDGNLTIDNGRFNAISHVYPAFIAERAKEGLKGLRNALLSKRGHKRLSDTVHPDEFYRAYYEHGLEPELTANLRHSEFEIEFTRDPRRFLVSGDTPQDVSVTSETLSGSVVTFDNATGADRITGLSVSIMAAQSGSGDPSPTNIRPITGWDGAEIRNNETVYPVTWSEAGTVYGGTLDVINGTLTKTHEIVDLGSFATSSWTANGANSVWVSIPGKKIASQNNYCSALKMVASNVGVDVMPDGSFKAYSSSSGIAIKLSGITTNNASSMLSGIMFVYELATPVTYQLAPTEITTLIGENNIWADCGDVSVTLQLPSTLINPTLFPSSPKIRVHGQGTLYIGNTAITVGGSFPYVDIDTEIADCSYEGQNANQYVTFSGLDFPKLEPGENYITFTGFTAVEVTPRWWRL